MRLFKIFSFSPGESNDDIWGTFIVNKEASIMRMVCLWSKINIPLCPAFMAWWLVRIIIDRQVTGSNPAHGIALIHWSKLARVDVGPLNASYKPSNCFLTFWIALSPSNYVPERGKSVRQQTSLSPTRSVDPLKINAPHSRFCAAPVT